MSTVRFIGDLHGNWRWYKRMIRKVPASIQVGDMGVGFRTMTIDGEVRALSNPPFDAMSRGDHRFIRGNHDNPEVCRSHRYWIPDGTSHSGVFCLGGAVSIDKDMRVEGLDWWRDEELTYSELGKVIDVYEQVKPDVLCTHDCPESIARQILSHFRKDRIEDGSATRQALDIMTEIHKPRLHVFGHWHHDLSFMRGDTRYVCLAPGSYLDVDLSDPHEGDIRSIL